MINAKVKKNSAFKAVLFIAFVMDDSLNTVLGPEVGALAADQSLEAILNDSVDFLEHLQQLRAQLAEKSPKSANSTLNSDSHRANLAVKANYYNSQTLKHEKALSKRIRAVSSKIDALKGPSLDTIYPFELAGTTDEPRQMDVLSMCIFIDLLHQGRFELLDALDPHLHFSKYLLSSKGSVPPSLNSLYNAYKPLLAITNALQDGNYVPLLNWVHQNALNVEAHNPLYELQLVTDYTVVAMSKASIASAGALPSDIYAVSPLLQDLRSKWYYSHYLASVAEPAEWCVMPIAERISTFRTIYVAVAPEATSLGNLPPASPLDQLLTVAHVSAHVFAKHCLVQNSIDTHDEPLKHLPFEVELPHWMQHHSIFICPVSREESSKDDPPMYMPCGHLVSKDAVKSLSKNGARHFKCPYCPQTTTPAQCFEVEIADA